MTGPLALLLAAGVGRRMGGPKALLVVDGKPLVLAHVQRLQEAGCRPIVVVVRESIATQVRELLSVTPEAQLCVADTSSMAASLRAALGSVPPHPGRAVVVSPIDTLPVRLSTLDTLLSAVLAPQVHVATPRYQTRGGHPIVARESLLQAFRDGYPGTLRELLRTAEPQRLRVDLDDADVASDLDTPADLAAHRPGLVPEFAGPDARASPELGVLAVWGVSLNAAVSP
jgi:CTP:molybdopterin cytidylyltransferase MocA